VSGVRRSAAQCRGARPAGSKRSADADSSFHVVGAAAEGLTTYLLTSGRAQPERAREGGGRSALAEPLRRRSGSLTCRRVSARGDV
jgi:hypothetical protein